MTAKEGCTTCKEKVEALIANTASKFDENDREMLETLTSAQLDKMEPVEVEKEVKAEITPEMAVNALKEGWKTPDDVINAMPEGMQEQMRSALAVHKEHKDSLVKGIMTNAGEGVWEKEDLEAMPMAQLEKIAKTAGFQANSTPTNYAGQAAGGGKNFNTNGEGEVEPMLPFGVNKEKSE